MTVTLVVGTAKGGFVYQSGASRRSWSMRVPFFKGWKVTAMARDDADTVWCGTASDVYGAALHRSTDLDTWQQITDGPAYPQGGTARLTQIWRILPGPTRSWLGVADAGLFCSTDRGASWKAVPGLNDHVTRAAWCPGAGGLCAHSILADHTNPQRVWVGISAVGVFRSDDGGASWHPRNQGVPVILPDKMHEDIGYCVHALVQDPDDPNLIYRQDHKGMFRTRNAAESWERIENGLPSGFGFPLVQDPNTRRLFAVPLESDEFRLPAGGRLRVFKSDNSGDSWEPLTTGLPQEHAYAGVLRTAMAVDGLPDNGVYLGTTSGEVYASADNGARWSRLPGSLPRIQCVAAFVDR